MQWKHSAMSDQPIISIRDLRKIYRLGEVEVQALRGVDLDIQRGEFLSIVGPSGSGKSTLFHIIGGLTPPHAGQGHICGQGTSPTTPTHPTRLREPNARLLFHQVQPPFTPRGPAENPPVGRTTANAA